MRFVSWNVNGIRAVLKKNFLEVFDAFNADIFAIQETKCQVGQVELDLPGYHQYWSAAEKKGYSLPKPCNTRSGSSRVNTAVPE